MYTQQISKVYVGFSASSSRKVNKASLRGYFVKQSIRPSRVQAVEIEAILEQTKEKLIFLAEGTFRGASTSKELSNGLLECVRELEASNSAPVSNLSVDGQWELVWSTTAPERASSPMFWSFSGLTDTLVTPGISNQVFQWTDSFLKPAVGVKYGNIKQTISVQDQSLKSEVELMVSPAGLGVLEIAGNVISEAKLVPTGEEGVYDVSMLSTRVENSPLPFVGDISFPIETVFAGLTQAHNTVRGTSVERPDVVQYRTTYVNDNMRISRVAEEVFVYKKKK
uniref:Plastid lipid-associated protein/fibrillin conserved domain-containing protein n=1 Tax=Polyblepharides amylifera TaxID=1486889 RepID=A0A7R9XMX6_9CHLO|mmetsp:Transcript_1155/g.1619  ORF Transcript_1155/g.1619 Transcript_1155/m.1619 type:complete len:281 (+) Transcript_1155:78-920(+)|eukprot:CAMPEP_0196583366 /NCGR_PEP_ID=MMETSP1081-20130531/43258_1 /TAXON_ID=36882 /ORGANISM="Pyramimonas amylifera, Strain CCMP720" /LENGTH=280 /DNA_ID=CAMNT_0041904233 /DNA_START=68 /DNA_END=910 /DNA_ORIENTATION=+